MHRADACPFSSTAANPPGVFDVTRCLNATGGFAGWLSDFDRPPLVAWEQYLDLTRPNIFFVQIGAHEGKSAFDPLYTYSTRCGWRGVVLEPTPKSFERLCTNYAPYAQHVEPLRVALSDHDGLGHMQVVNRFCARKGECNYLHTGPPPKGRQAAWHKGFAGTNETNPVAMVSLSTLWPDIRRRARRHAGAAARVDLLVIDVEGLEGKVLAHADLPRPLPKLLMWEHKKMPKTERDLVDTRLVAQGYRNLGSVGGRWVRNGGVWTQLYGGDTLYSLSS